jgi:hypothetical protein
MTVSEAVEALVAKSEITEKIYLYGRGCDRADSDVLKAIYHPDATEEHGVFSGPARDFVGMVVEVRSTFASMSHHISNVIVELDGDKALAESYFLAVGFGQAGEQAADDVMLGGRCLDRFERRDGDWRIAHRQVVFDWYFLVAGAGDFTDRLARDWRPQGAIKPDDFLYKHLAARASAAR